MAKKPTGGRRPGAGRKPGGGVPKQVKLSPAHWAKAGRIGVSKTGKENAAEGIRRALDAYPEEQKA